MARRAPFHYRIHDLAAVRSERRLPELERFLTGTPPKAAPDIDVRVVADPLRGAAPGAITYREQPGRLGFALTVEQDEPTTRVAVSPLVGGSPHVLYTNVVEPLLRWLLVRKGYALMHGACLAAGRDATFITARTDTGKTTTILNTLRAAGGRFAFLSDDMTILGRDGSVYAYPKPLTISSHTVRAIGGAPLAAGERARLAYQSRLHSKGGRSAGMRLYEMGLPAATLSAIVQWLVPPPKFMVERLVPGTRGAERATLRRVVLIERGPDAILPLAAQTLPDLLLANAEDAYGFPPYPVLRDQLTRWRGEELAGRERAIVRAALTGVEGTVVRSSSFGWHEVLLSMLGGGRVERGPAHAAAAAGAAGNAGALGALDGSRRGAAIRDLEAGALDG